MKYLFFLLLVVSALMVGQVQAQGVEVEVKTGDEICAPVNPPTPDDNCRFDEVKDENSCVTGYVQVCEDPPGFFMRIWNWLTSLFKRG